MKATELNTAVFTFGRFNPPTIGHAKLVDMLKRQPGKPYVFLSHSQGAKNPDAKPGTKAAQNNDPLSYGQKLYYVKNAFPDVAVGDYTVKNIIQVLQKLESLGYANVTMVAGSDRVEEFKTFLDRYNGKEYNFDNISVVSAGQRDPDSDGVEGMSASKMRQFAVSGDFENFQNGVMNKSDAKKMYDEVRAGMGLKEYGGLGFATTTPKRHIITKKKSVKPELSIAQKLAQRRDAAAKGDPNAWKSISWKNESITEALDSKPDVYVDMDGVIADFFSALANFRGVNHWKEPGGKFDVEDSIKAIAGTDFFSTLPVIPTAKQLISIVKNFTGGEWHICSSPLRGDHENSKKHKIAWLNDNGFDPTTVIITGRKESHATTRENDQFRPNILIDDKPSNIERWQMKNGIALRYQANKDSLSRVQTALKIIQDYMAKKQGPWTAEEVQKVNSAIDTGTILEYGRVVQGVNTTIDVGVDAITKQSAKMGFKVDKDGRPPNLREKKTIFDAIAEDDLKFQNEKGNLSLNTLPGTKKWQKAKANSKPGTGDWFKTWRAMPLLTKGRKNHYMPPVNENLYQATPDELGNYRSDPTEPKAKAKRWYTGADGVLAQQIHRASRMIQDFKKLQDKGRASDELKMQLITMLRLLLKKAEGVVAESWSEKYKRSIDCANPKGFSQKAHCAGKKKK